MAARTQERRDDQAVLFSSIRRQPMRVGSTVGPRARMQARDHMVSQLSADQTSSYGSTAERVGRFSGGSTPSYVQDMHTSKFEGCPVGNESELQSALYDVPTVDQRGEFAGMTSMGGVRYAQLHGSDSSGMRQDFHSRMESGYSLMDRMGAQTGYQGPIDGATAHLASGVTSGIRQMQLNSTGCRGSGGFVERTPGSSDMSAYSTIRARTARGVERRSHATGIASARGSVFE